MMDSRRRLLATLLALLGAAAGLSACSEQRPADGSSPQGAVSNAPQDDRPDITPETVREKLFYWRVRTPNVENEKETVPWRFSRAELQEMNVVERRFEGDRAQITVDVKTRPVAGSPKPVSSEGRVRLDFEMESGLVLREWKLRRIENISFKFRREYKEEPKPSPKPGEEDYDEDAPPPPPPPPAPPGKPPAGNQSNAPPANKQANK